MCKQIHVKYRNTFSQLVREMDTSGNFVVISRFSPACTGVRNIKTKLTINKKNFKYKLITVINLQQLMRLNTQSNKCFICYKHDLECQFVTFVRCIYDCSLYVCFIAVLSILFDVTVVMRDRPKDFYACEKMIIRQWLLVVLPMNLTQDNSYSTQSRSYS